MGVYALVVGAVAWSAILAKEAGKTPTPLAAISLPESAPVVMLPIAHVAPASPVVAIGAPEVEIETAPVVEIAAPSVNSEFANDPSIRWFNGRPVRPAREIWMEVTAYSPDERSCPGSADGITATLHSVETNGFALVAADPKVLPYGSMLTVPGYDDNNIVPVLDCGGAIKGRRLDVIYPTHERAKQWGRQRLKVTVWEYADGKPAENPRKER